jgi:hypothetical protein
MNTIKFGNWSVDRDTLKWNGDKLQQFTVKIQDILETDESGEMYEWIIRATEEDWLTDDDLYDFNFAFIYAAALKGSSFDYSLFDRTVAYQYELLEGEEAEQPSLNDLSKEEADLEQQRKNALSERD